MVEQRLALADRIPGVVRGEDEPGSVAEAREFASLCSRRGLHATASRLLADVLADNPKLAADREAQVRYHAACAAAQAGCGRGKDDPAPDDATREKLRQQARGWLLAELSAWKRIAMTAGSGNRPQVALALAQWKRDADLACVRDPEGLSKLPEAERREWTALWADVEGLLKKVQASAPGKRVEAEKTQASPRGAAIIER